MKFGAEPKKVAALAVLLVVAAGVYYYMSSDDSGPAPRPVASAPTSVMAPPPAGLPPRRARGATDRRSTTRGAVSETKFRIGFTDPKDRPDPATVDPTIHYDLLAKVQAVDVGAPGRNLFQIGPPPPPPTPKELPKTDKIIVTKAPPATPVDSGPPPPPPPPQAPPMTFKYYGYKVSRLDGRKAAFLLDGEDILITGENDTFKRHYRVVKIGINSITIEDTQFKSTQTLQLQETPAPAA